MIRLQRVGRKHEPVFRLVLTDAKNAPQSGKFLEILGSYDPRKEGGAELKADRIKHWIESGAKLSGTAHNLLIEKKIITGKKINVLPKKTATKKIEESKEEKIEKTEEVKEEKAEAAITEAEPSPEASAGEESKPQEDVAEAASS